MKTNLPLSVFAGLLMILLPSYAIKAQSWFSMNSGTTSDLYGVNFPSPEVGYAVGFKILKTIDAGITWSDKTPVTTSYFNAVYFISINVGYVAGGTGDILKTTDGGTSWTKLTNIYEGDLRSVCFTGDKTGYVVGSNWGTGIGLIYKTTDGGLTWINQSLPGTQVQLLKDVFFVNHDTGFAVGGQGTIVKTTNGGTTWSVYNIDWKYSLNAIYFPDPDTGYAVGWNQTTIGGAIFKSTDGGLNWSEKTPANFSDNMLDVWFSDVNRGYAVGDHLRIMHTVDGGVNWTDQYTNFPDTSRSLYSLHFTSPDIGYAVGPSGTIIKTTDGGLGIRPENENSPEIKLWPNPANSTIWFSNIPVSGNLHFEISDLQGKLMLSGILPAKIQKIDISSIPAGIFLLKLSTLEQFICPAIFVKR